MMYLLSNLEKGYNSMELNEYQEKAMGTCLPSCDNFSYMMLNLVGEVGEFAGKVAKAIRKDCTTIEVNDVFDLPLDTYDDLKSEAGDILWQLAGLCKVMGWDLNDVAQCNLDKLANRKKEGTIITHQDH